MKKISRFICFKCEKERYQKYEKFLLFLSLFVLVFDYVVIFLYRHFEKISSFSWQLYPFFLILYFPLIHSFIFHLKNKTYKFSIIDLGMIIYLELCIISTLFSKDIQKSLLGNGIRNEGLITIVFYILVYFLAKNTVNKSNICKIINMIFGFGILQVAYGIAQSYLKWMAYFDEMAYGFTGNPNMFGLLIGTLLTISICFYLSENMELKKYNKYYLLCVIIFYIGLILAESSAPFFMFCLILVFVLIYSILKQVNLKKILIILLIICTIFPIVQYSNKYINQKYYECNPEKASQNKDYSKLNTDIEKILGKVIINKKVESNEKNENSNTNNNLTHGKIEIWKKTYDVANKNCINGIGLDCLSILWAHDDICEKINKAHNQYLDIWVSIGICGAILYLVIISVVIIIAFRSKNNICKYLGLGFLYYSLTIIFNISTPFVAVYYYIIIGLIIGIEQISRSEYGKN